jgi:tripartite-type tricarboxylate transporter receptor subunit TctC
VKLVQRSDIQKRLREDGLVPEPFDLVEFRAFITQEIARWKPMLKETGFAAQ